MENELIGIDSAALAKIITGSGAIETYGIVFHGIGEQRELVRGGGHRNERHGKEAQTELNSTHPGDNNGRTKKTRTKS